MNDRFKFRVWHTEVSELIYEDRYGDCFKWYNEGQPVKLEQCTGLKDKNGKLVYEGDIVKFGWSIWVVNWNEDESCWYASDYDMLCAVGTSDDEVIGNIHENGDLLD